MWIFAYGSLIFRPAFDYLERRRAYAAGWARRFWQGSPDHRGVPEDPGRVVTLIEEAGSLCGGVAYRVAPEAAEAILALLDAREQAGFERRRIPLAEAAGGPAFDVGLTYVAPPGNAHFLGPLEEAEIAAWIARCRGPSGPNREYALRLHAALAELGIEDPHVAAIARALG